jgi:hypothetical protein
MSVVMIVMMSRKSSTSVMNLLRLKYYLCLTLLLSSRHSLKLRLLRGSLSHTGPCCDFLLLLLSCYTLLAFIKLTGILKISCPS